MTTLDSSTPAIAMTPTTVPPRTARRLGAVIAGLVAVALLSHATDAVMHATGVFSPYGRAMTSALYLLPLAYRVVFGALGAYVAARLAPNRPRAHALALGAVGVALGLLGAVATWNAGTVFGPRWYPLALVALTLPSAWLGGHLAVRRGATAAS